uniref:Uncharacterized protein AlNc14C47G3797 n=1 Tax=Albugo laibachii Nc14 TaxID=890382 RepID=F0WAT5_9STRA|nr:conserved hypothetical protein [Albugo laibachii Nc14]|eukprot:CCA18257.1 conserved hypothetical protein [Albugo laibachii Nc14]
MGSYLTIINNSDQTYECKVGANEKVIQESMFTVTLLGAGLGALAVSGLVKSFAVGSAIFGTGLFGMHITGLYGPNNQLKSIRTTMQQFDYFSENSVPSINTELAKRQFFTIKPLESHQYGKMFPGLLRQATCVHTVNISNVTLDMQVVLLRPIWSSPIPNRNRDYDIKVALEKKGALHYMVYSARFMEYENKTFSAQPIFPISSSQPPVTPIDRTESTSLVSNSPVPASVSLTNYQPTSFSASQPTSMSIGDSYSPTSPDSSERAIVPYVAKYNPDPSAYGGHNGDSSDAAYSQDSSTYQYTPAATTAPSTNDTGTTNSSSPSYTDSPKASIQSASKSFQ